MLRKDMILFLLSPLSCHLYMSTMYFPKVQLFTLYWHREVEINVSSVRLGVRGLEIIVES